MGVRMGVIRGRVQKLGQCPVCPVAMKMNLAPALCRDPAQLEVGGSGEVGSVCCVALPRQTPCLAPSCVGGGTPL